MAINHNMRQTQSTTGVILSRSALTCVISLRQTCKEQQTGAREPWGQGVKWPQKFTWGSNMVFWLPDFFLESNIFRYTPTRCYWGYIIIILYSESRSRSVYFC